MDASSQDGRDRVVRAVDRGERPTASADRFAVRRVWVSQVRNRLTQTGPRSRLPIGGHRRSRLAGMEPTRRAWLKETGDLTLAELCARLAAHGIAIKASAWWHQLDEWTRTLKKPPARQRARADVRPARRLASVPHGHWYTTTCVAGLRHDDLTAPMVADGAMTGALFLKYVQECVCPTLHPGDIVIADHVRSQKMAGVKEAVEAVGAHLRYLPPYSPDRNPIETLFATLTALLRKAAPRTGDALWADIGMRLDRFTPDECTRYFASSGSVKT